MSFETIAKEIVHNSIKSAICVDNAFVEPYSTVEEGDDYQTPKALFESFKKEKCNLNVYKYTNVVDWEKSRDYILKNNDLLILDWELRGDPPFKDALKILGESVESRNLWFILIYTRQTDLSVIKLNIHSYFSKYYKQNMEISIKYNTLCDRLSDETEILNVDELFRKISSELKEFVMGLSNQLQLKTNILDAIRKIIGNELFPQFMEKFNSIGSQIFNQELEDIFKLIGCHISNALPNPQDNYYVIRQADGMENTFLINNILIVIYNKVTASSPEGPLVISADNIYANFAETLCKKPRNFLTLLALEMKNLYRENSNVIGQELSDIDEIAFFHHQNKLPNEDSFYDFLRNCWKNQLSAFNYAQTPKLFSVLLEYKELNKYGELLKEFRAKRLDQFQMELVKLNYNYSFLKVIRKTDDRIRFGDLFIFKNVKTGNEEYVLCITPHCDCLFPEENIFNKFYFASGHNISMDKALHEAENGLYSFLMKNRQPFCIKWDNTPFTLYIPKEENNVSKIISVHHHNIGFQLQYLATQKENYTQRVANKVFSHASRIGVEYAHLNDEE